MPTVTQRLTLIAALAGLPTAVPLRAAPAQPSPTVSVEALEAERVQAFAAQQAEPLAAACTAETRLLTEGVPTVIGADNIVAYYRALFARYAVGAYDRGDVQRRELGTRVAEFGRFRLRLAPKGPGRPLDLPGKYLDLWRRGPAGGWQLEATAWNYDAWLADGGALRLEGVPAVRTALEARVPLDTDLSLELAGSSLLMQRAVVEHDAALLSRFYAEDAVLLPNYAPLAQGRPRIAAFWAAHSLELPIFEELDLRNDRIEEDGAYVVEFACHTANWRRGVASGVSTGKNLRLWRREPDHRLRMVLQISAYD